MLISNFCRSSIGMSSLLLPSPFSLYPSMSPQIPFRSFPHKRIQNKFPVPTFSLGYQNVVLTCKAEEEVEEEVGSSRNVTVLCKAEEEVEEEVGSIGSVTVLYSFSSLPLILLGALPGGDNTAAAAVTSLFGPFVELVKSLNLPYWLVHWGHPANMAVVLFAMGGYGTYLGFRIRFSEDVEEKAKAKDLHPKLLGGMFFFFALGATGGITSLLTSGRPIFESPHAVTGFIGLSLLTIQTILPTFFEGNPGLKNVHGILGSGIMTLFLVHSALGLQLGLA